MQPERAAAVALHHKGLRHWRELQHLKKEWGNKMWTMAFGHHRRGGRSHPCLLQRHLQALRKQFTDNDPNNRAEWWQDGAKCRASWREVERFLFPISVLREVRVLSSVRESVTL